MSKKIISIVLSLLMALGCLSLTAAAAAADVAAVENDVLAFVDGLEFEDGAIDDLNDLPSGRVLSVLFGFLNNKRKYPADKTRCEALFDSFNALGAEMEDVSFDAYSVLFRLASYYYAYYEGEGSLDYIVLDPAEAAQYVGELLDYVPADYVKEVRIHDLAQEIYNAVLAGRTKDAVALLREYEEQGAELTEADVLEAATRAGELAESAYPAFWAAFKVYEKDAGAGKFDLAVMRERFSDYVSDTNEKRGIPAFAYVADVFTKAVAAKTDAAAMPEAAVAVYALTDAEAANLIAFDFDDNGLNPYRDYIVAAADAGAAAVQRFIDAIAAIPQPYTNASIPAAQVAYDALPALLRNNPPADKADALAAALQTYMAIRANVGPDAQIDNTVDLSAYKPADVSGVGDTETLTNAMNAFSPVIANALDVRGVRTADALVKAVLIQKILTNDTVKALAAKLGTTVKSYYGFNNGDAAGFFEAVARVLADAGWDVNRFINTVDAQSAIYNYNGYEDLIPIYEVLELSPMGSAALTDQAKAANDVAFTAFKLMLAPLAGCADQLLNGGWNAALALLPRLAYAIDSGMLSDFASAYLADYSLDLSAAGVYNLFKSAMTVKFGDYTVSVSQGDFTALVKNLAGCASAAKAGSVSIYKNRLALNSDNGKTAVVLIGLFRAKADALASQASKTKVVNAMAKDGASKINLFDKLAIRLQFNAMTKAEGSFKSYAGLANAFTKMFKAFASFFGMLDNFFNK